MTQETDRSGLIDSGLIDMASSISQASALSRRTMLKAMGGAAAMAMMPSVLAQEAKAAPIPVRKIQNFGLRVTDVRRSLRFYQELFGMPVQARVGNTVCLQVGDGPIFFSLTPVRGRETPGITHIGLSVEDYDTDGLSAALTEHGLNRGPNLPPGQPQLSYANRIWTVTRPGTSGTTNTRDLFFADSEGLTFQLCSPNHCGGGGEVGEQCPFPEASPSEGIMQLVDINHFTNFMSNSPRANQFYRDLFGLDYLAYQGPTMPTVGVGDGKQFLMFVGGAEEGRPSRAARIDHVSLSVTDFDVDAILGKLTDYGLTARENPSETPPLSHWVSMRMPERGGAEGGTPELYFSDPDGIHIQLQHVDYCGGGGYLGDQCG